MVKKLLLLVLAIGMLLPLDAQRMSWKKHRNLAEDAFERGDYVTAAENFEQAWQKKQSKTEFIYQAGEAYYLIKDYRKAAEAYQHVKNRNDTYPLVGLKYARSLKQDGQYDKAMQAFREFANSYTGEGKAILDDIIQTEIQGCNLGKELPARMDREVQLSYTGRGINSDDNEFAPYPSGGDELYFSSSRGDKARLYVTRRQGGGWSEASIPAGFPVIQNNHYCNGALAPDGQRFYFTICSGDQKWDNLKTRCELFYLKRSGASWSQPERLPDYVNMQGVTATHPAVAHIDDQEVLYFSSNREGGRGGFDLWYITRDLNLDNNDYTFPVNLGPTINTLGDEITPYYDAQNSTLFFSSNGHVSIGGFDILQSGGSEVTWSVPQNAGLPLNSSADDYYYVKNLSGIGGFLVSNRVFGGEKTNTRHADIFEVVSGAQRTVVSGNVYDQRGNPVNAISVALYQIFDDGVENQLITKSYTNGSYSFELFPDRTFKVVISSYGFEPASYQFTTNDPSTKTYGQPVYLKPGTGVAPTADRPTEPGYPTTGGATRPPSVNPPPASGGAPRPIGGVAEGATYTSRGTSPKDNFEYVSSAPRYEGVYYKIQLAAVSSYNPGKFNSAASVGRVDTEKLVSRNLTRVLIGDFFSPADARRAMQDAKAAGYTSAYIVQYEDGMRFGKVTL